MRKSIQNESSFTSILKSVEELYWSKLYPLEEETRFQQYHLQPIDESYFTSRPLILVMGQVSSGKTTFLRSLVKQDFPGMKIGREPTTDGFTVLQYCNVRSISPGNALVFDPSKPYKGLSKFGCKFMDRLQGANVNCELLKHVTLIDTPGFVSKSKPPFTQEYDFEGVLQWFAERAFLILIVIDACTLDISDQLKTLLVALQVMQDKIRIVINKADQLTPQKLKNVYGDALWSLAHIFSSSESLKVYIGSFWENALKSEENRKLFEMEKIALFTEIQKLPRTHCAGLLNNIVKRARLVLIHTNILTIVRNETQGIFKSSSCKKKVIDGLPNVYIQINSKLNFSLDEFPDVEKLQKVLEKTDVQKIPKFTKRFIDDVYTLMDSDLPPLKDKMTNAEAEIEAEMKSIVVYGGQSDSSPFDEDLEATANSSTEGENKCSHCGQHAIRSTTPNERLSP